MICYEWSLERAYMKQGITESRPTYGNEAVLERAAGLRLYGVLQVFVGDFFICVERGSQLREAATTQHHVDGGLVRAELTFSSLDNRHDNKRVSAYVMCVRMCVRWCTVSTIMTF